MPGICENNSDLHNADDFQSEENNDKKDKKKQKLGEVLDQIDWVSESSSSESCNVDRFLKVNTSKCQLSFAYIFFYKH